MNKKEKIDKTALVFDPIVFTERQLYREKRKYRIFKSLFVFINIAIFVASLSVAIITPLYLAKYLVISDNKDKNMEWYLFYTALVAAGTTFAASIVNFMYIKQKFEKAIKNFHFIQREIIMYASKSEVYENTKLDKDILLFERVAKKIDYAQKEEGIND